MGERFRVSDYRSVYHSGRLCRPTSAVNHRLLRYFWTIDCILLGQVRELHIVVTDGKQEWPGTSQRWKMDGYFVLDDRGEPVPERDLDAWTRWFERADRSISRTIVTPEITVLTTFRGVVDASEVSATPALFETRVFGGILDGVEVRHKTRAEALDGHAVLAEWCRIALLPNHGITAEQIS